jgi:hypothetical protein
MTDGTFSATSGVRNVRLLALPAKRARGALLIICKPDISRFVKYGGYNAGFFISGAGLCFY